MKQVYTIYMHKNKINNKVYIGQTCQIKTHFRWGHNGNHYKDQPKFFRAIQKYGWDNFEHLILETNLSKEVADIKERELIILYNSIENGYNTADGGQTSRHATPKVYKLDKNKNILAIYTSYGEAGRANNVNCNSIRYCCLHQYGYVTSAGFYWCLAIDYDSYIIPKSKNHKKVIQLTLDDQYIRTYTSTREASRYTNICHENIAACCRHKLKRAGNYKWIYLEEYDNEKRKNKN